MSISFGQPPNYGWIFGTRSHRARLRDASSAIIVARHEHRARLVESVNGATLVLRRPHRARLRDSAGSTILARYPVRHVLVGEAAPVPQSDSSAYIIAGKPPHYAQLSGSRINHGSVAGQRAKGVRLTDIASLFLLRRTHHAALVDTLVRPAAGSAILLQQPYLIARGHEGVDIVASDYFTSSDDAYGLAIQALLDLFAASDGLVTHSAVVQALSEIAGASDLTAYDVMVALADAVAASATLVTAARIVVMLADSAQADDVLFTKSAILAALEDGFYASALLGTDADEPIAWVMTPQTRAMRSYSAFPFNSMAMFQGQLYGATSDGVHALDTESDDTLPWSIRTGLTDLGTRREKRVEKCYIGYSKAGDLCLRVCTTKDGEKVAYTYKAAPKSAGAPTAGRIPVGRGIKGVYYSFELLGTDDFELYDVSILPMELSRRIY